MKKLIAMFALILMFSIGCEKEKTLSDYVIGDWTSQALTLDGNDVYFTVEFKTNGKYILTAYNSQNDEPEDSLSEVDYTVFGNQISIVEPDFDQEASGDPIMITFNVIWTADGNEMTWIPVVDDGAPTIVWTRQ